MSKIASRRYLALFALIMLATVSLFGGRQIHAQDGTPAASPTTPPVVRETLVTGLPEGAPGQDLQLVRYVIQPGTTLPMHTHPGM